MSLLSYLKVSLCLFVLWIKYSPCSFTQNGHWRLKGKLFSHGVYRVTADYLLRECRVLWAAVSCSGQHSTQVGSGTQGCQALSAIRVCISTVWKCYELPSSFQIHETIETINQLKTQREFMLSFARDPQGFINDWLQSQCRDLKVKIPGEEAKRVRPVKLLFALFLWNLIEEPEG